MQKLLTAVSRGRRLGRSAEATIIYAGIVCCGAAILLVLAVAAGTAG